MGDGQSDTRTESTEIGDPREATQAEVEAAVESVETAADSEENCIIVGGTDG